MSLFMAHRELQTITLERWNGVPSRNVKAMVTGMTSAFVDNYVPASLAAHLTFASYECPTDLPVIALMCV